MPPVVDRRATQVVLVAHGSRAAAANEAHEAVAKQLTDQGEHPVMAAFLELAEPSIPDAIARVAADGATSVLVLPYFLYPGRHMTRDIPALIEEASAAHPDVSITMLDAFGSDPGAVELLGAQLRAGLARLDDLGE